MAAINVPEHKLFADFDSIKVGDVRALTKTISIDDVRRFVELTGDDNPLHVDRTYAESTPFKDIVVHGMLGASFISTVIGTKLPGPGALWVSQNMEFQRPVRLGDELKITCTVLKKHERDRLIELHTAITNQKGEDILTGHAKVKVLATKVVAKVDNPGERSRVAIVTGGSGGIGVAIARRLATDGHAIVVNYLNRRDRANAIVNELRAEGFRAIALQGDVSVTETALSVVQEAIETFGSVGVLVNTAAPSINAKPLDRLDWLDIQKHLDVQVRGALEMIKACVPHMTAAHYGRIINITSQVVQGNPSVHWTSYAVGKAALATLSRYVAAELGPSGVTVNCVSPGMTETNLIGDIPEKVQMMVARQTPLRRLSLPDDVAAAVAYLASDDAGFVTGHTLSVNGGITMI